MFYFEARTLGALAPKPPLRDGCVPQTPSKRVYVLVFRFLFFHSSPLTPYFSLSDFWLLTPGSCLPHPSPPSYVQRI
ncbi:MAG TPA: hypothetical protein V6C63_16295, partial [Allocoleopsis sp.]